MKYTIEVSESIQEDLDLLMQITDDKVEDLIQHALACGIGQVVRDAQVLAAFEAEPGPKGMAKLKSIFK